MELKITPEDLERLGTLSLQGRLYNKYGTSIDSCKSLKIIFVETSYAWRRKHGSATEIIMPEYVPFCLVESILSFIDNGFEIKIEREYITPPDKEG